MIGVKLHSFMGYKFNNDSWDLQQDAWSNVGNHNVTGVLESVKKYFSILFPSSDFSKRALNVFKSSSNTPWINNDRNKIYLNIENEAYYGQFIYQFAHELGHFVIRSDNDTYHKICWLEESLCFALALDTLICLSVTWRFDPPFEYMRDFAPKLYENYIENISKAKFIEIDKLPNYIDGIKDEINNRYAYQIGEQETLKKQLLNIGYSFHELLFKHNRSLWNSITFLREIKVSSTSIPEIMLSWHNKANSQYKPFIKTFSALVQLK